MTFFLCCTAPNYKNWGARQTIHLISTASVLMHTHYFYWEGSVVKYAFILFFHFFSYFLHSLALGFDLFHIQCNIFWSWMSATIKNDSPAKTPSISALLGFHELVCARKHTRGGGPAAHNVNQSLHCCQRTSGYLLGAKRAQWRVLSITFNYSPLLCAWRDFKRTVFPWGVCFKGALRPPPDCDGTLILIYYPL